MSSHANRNMCQVPGGRSRRMDCCYYYLELIFRVAVLYTCCSLLPSATLAQTTSAASGGGFHSPGNQRVNSLVTSERSTSYPDLARDFQQTTPQNHAATAWTPSSSRTIADNSLITAATTTGASTALGAIVHATSLAPVPTQPKHLKFTLIAGKYWKFNIKTNSLQASHGERELRLHGNDSARNFIIDDDGWFQYNHQQQQLFAWPSLSVKSATYNFVLLPSGIDYEADSENGLIKPSDVAANIVVEVIRPYTGSNAPSSRFDIDQLIDHKFSLEYLHRHSSYPLLLSQIVSVFDIIARTNSINTRNTLSSQSSDSATSVSRATTPPQQSSTSTSSSITALLQQTKQTKLLSNKLIEFLLIDSSATADGEYFSLTWTSHPSLVNNTVHPINECRLQSINETISRLSSRSIVYSSSADDKYVIPYSLDSPLANTQSIIPTERGNYALKLSLLHPCRDKHVFEELGVSPTAQELPTSGIDYRVNDLPDLSTVDTTTETSALEPSKETNTSSSVSTSSNGPIEIGAGESTDSLPGELLERGQTNHGVTELKSWPVAVESPRPSATSEPPRPLTTREPPIAAIYDQTITSHRPNSPKILLKSTQLPQELLIATTTRPSNSSISADQIVATPPTQIYRPTDSINTQPSTAEQAAAGQSSPPAFERTQHAPTQAQINTRRAIESTVPSIPPSPSINFEHHPETNSDPQAGSSLANPLDLQIDIKPKTIMSQVNPPVTTNVPITNANISLGTTSNIIPATVTNATNASTGNPTPIASKSDQETSLNDDLIGILNEVMEYLVSVAVPLSIILGVILIASIFIAICNLCAKRRKAKRFETDDRFKFRYGSERKMFLKNRSKPVILEADQKSLSMGGTPQHKPLMTPLEKDGDSKKKGKKKGAQSKHNDKSSGRSNFFDMHLFPSTGNYDMGGSSGGAGHGGGGGFLGGDCGDGGGFSGGDCGDGGGGDCGGCD